VSLDKNNEETLLDLGLTTSQARVYIANIKLGKVKAKDICKESGIGRQEVYRVLTELLELGLIEKVIGTPMEFDAVPLSRGIILLLNRKRTELFELEVKAKELAQKGINEMLANRSSVFTDSHFTIVPRKYYMMHRRLVGTSL
jgi:sugar-specific transcriptional regulator TrmB